MKPTRQEVKDGLLLVLAENGGALTTSVAYDALAAKLSLSDEVLSEKMPSGESWWENAVRWAREDLVREGYIMRPEESQRGLWVLKEGQSRAATSIPEEITGSYSEGSVYQLLVNAYERNEMAREACIKHYKAICTVCDFDFSKFYGSLGEGYIHVHHLVPISSIKKSYKLDPISDLRPVCPNCHAMLHTTEPPLTIEQLKARILLSDLL